MRDNIKQEIIENLKEIYLRLGIIIKLLYKYYIWKDTRNTRSVNDEYDKYWSSFWENRDIFRKDLTFTYNDKIITPSITPFDFRKKVIIKILTKKIKECRPKNVLEIGSGAGINLLMLAPLFPDIKFVGLELTNSGVNISKKFIKSPPPDFKDAHKMRKIKNVKIYKGDIIDNNYFHIFKNQKFEFVFTAAVLEQLNNYYDTAIEHIFSFTRSGVKQIVR